MKRMQDPLLQQVRAYWEALRDDAQPPFRSQVEARGIEAALSDVFLLHRTDTGAAVLRSTGCRIEALIGGKPSDRPLSVLFGEAWRMRAGELIEAVFAGPAILQLELTAQDAGVGGRLSGAMHILPLRDADGRLVDAIGCLVLDGHAEPRPTLFAIGHSQIISLAPQAIMPVPQARPGIAQGFSEPISPFAAPPATRPKPPYLRLVQKRDKRD